MRLSPILATLTLASILGGSAAAARPTRESDPAAVRRVLVRYFDAIRHDDRTTACRMYRIPGCGDGKPFGLASYRLGAPERLRPPAEGDWGNLVYLYAPRRSDGTRDAAVAIVVVTCRPACRITDFWGVMS